MHLRPLSRSEVRSIDRRAIDEFHLPGLALMENAGRSAAQWLRELAPTGPIAICCGKGNNGGDGFVVARHLEAWGYSVTIALITSQSDLSGDALTNYRIVRAARTPMLRWPDQRREIEQLVGQAPWIVDALLGTGAAGEVREPIRSFIEQLNACPGCRFAIDVPSGLDADTGEPLGVALRASYTATFVSRKLGFSHPTAPDYTGEVRVFDIGVPRLLLNEFAE